MSDVKVEVESSEVTKGDIVKLENSRVVTTRQNLMQGLDKDKNLKKQPKNGLPINKTKSGIDASLEFEEVSSISSPKCSDFTISSIESYEDDVENIIICVGNELAYQNNQDCEKDPYKNGNFKKQDDKRPGYKESRSYDKYDGSSSRWSRSERKGRNRSEEGSQSRYKNSPRRGNSRSRYSPSRSRWSGSWDRSRRYLSDRSRRSRSWDRSRRRRESRSPSYRRRRKYSRSRSRSRSISIKSPKLKLERRGSLTKRRRLTSESPVRSVWKLLDRRKVSQHGANSPKPPKTPPPPNSPPPAQPPPPPPPEQRPIIPHMITDNVTNVVSSSYPWLHQENHSQNFYPFQNPPMPKISINNLPLVQGFGNLPVHVTMTGEQILHDMDGRPIPVGPNGLLLPLDLSGRLYPHIVFPCNNQAVPIYMSDDGVLRLPNGEPVPYGPPNQLPINVDGRFIPIGPDRRPLFPCPNIPRQNPLITLPAANPGGPCVVLNEQYVQQIQSINPPLPVKEINRNGNQRLRVLPPAVIEIKTVPEGQIKKNQVVNVQKSSEPEGKKPNEIVPKCSSSKVERKKPYEDVDLPKLVEKFTERINKINVSAIYQKKIEGVKEGVKNEKMDDVASSIKLEVDPRNDKEACEENPDWKKGDEISSEEKAYIETIQEAISFFDDIDFRPPLYGRFLFSDSSADLKLPTPPDESPLLRNKPHLPFLSTECVDPEPKSKKPSVVFRFLTQKDGKGGNVPEGKIPSTGVNHGVQCDFTSKTFKILQGRIDKLKRDLFRCRNENAELQDLCQSLRVDNQKKTEELGKVSKKMEEQKIMIGDLNQGKG